MKKTVVLLIAILVLPFLVLAGEKFRLHNTGAWKLSLPFGKSHNYADILVSRVVDGDTLQLESGEKVRLIGIDTPEVHESNKLRRDSEKMGGDKRAIQELGRRSWDFTKKLVEGKRVSLEFDVEKYDVYNRLLAYVYLKDGTFVNAEIISQGYASLMTFPPNVKHADLFVNLYREARENRRGLWK
ncbi:MAG: thermonuclease family protein [Candidatus Omnitrophica bacterium]|nr:thermonuclease family protein [Candidatus Omnitrophota bacterium]MDD5552387.1 thermonuclease family protein [Candidatus Omnitrophota bacterium]